MSTVKLAPRRVVDTNESSSASALSNFNDGSTTVATHATSASSAAVSSSSTAFPQLSSSAQGMQGYRKHILAKDLFTEYSWLLKFDCEFCIYLSLRVSSLLRVWSNVKVNFEGASRYVKMLQTYYTHPIFSLVVPFLYFLVFLGVYISNLSSSRNETSLKDSLMQSFRKYGKIIHITFDIEKSGNFNEYKRALIIFQRLSFILFFIQFFLVEINDLIFFIREIISGSLQINLLISWNQFIQLKFMNSLILD